MTLRLVCLMAAVIVFVFVALGVQLPRGNMMGLGLALLALAFCL